MFHTKPEDLTDSERRGNYRCAVERNARDLLRAGCHASCFNGSGAPSSARFITSAARNCGKPPRPENPQRRIATGFLRRSSSSSSIHRQRIPVDWREPSPLHRPSIRVYSCPACCRCEDRFATFQCVRCLFHFIKQGQFSFTLH